MKYKTRPAPKSREAALADPIKVVALEWQTDGSVIGILNRCESLQYDCGIDINEPVCSGELVCTAD